MRAQQILTGLVHGLEVHLRVAALPGKVSDERVFVPVDEIGIFPAAGAETGMQVIGHGGQQMNHDFPRQNGI